MDHARKLIREVTQACEICARFVPPMVSRELSIYHKNEAYYIEAKMDFMYYSIRGTKHVVLHLVDLGTEL